MRTSMIFAVASSLLASGSALSLRVTGDRRQELDDAWVNSEKMRACGRDYNKDPKDCKDPATDCDTPEKLKHNLCCASYIHNVNYKYYKACRDLIEKGTAADLNKVGNEGGKQAYGQVMDQTKSGKRGLVQGAEALAKDPNANVNPTEVGRAALAAFNNAHPEAEKLQHCNPGEANPSNEDVFKCCPQSDLKGVRASGGKNACCFMGRWVPLSYASTTPVWGAGGKAKFCYLKGNSMADQIGEGPLEKAADRLSSVVELVKDLTGSVRTREQVSVASNTNVQESGTKMAASHIQSGKEKRAELEMVIQHSFADAQADLRKNLAASEFLRLNTAKWQDSWAKEWIGLAKELEGAEKNAKGMWDELQRIGIQIVNIREEIDVVKPALGKCRRESEREANAVTQAQALLQEAGEALKSAQEMNEQAKQANKRMETQMKAKAKELKEIEKKEAEAKKKAEEVKKEQTRVKKSVQTLTNEIDAIKKKTAQINRETEALEVDFLELGTRGPYTACRTKVASLPSKDKVADTLRFCLCDPKTGSSKLRTGDSCAEESACTPHGTLGYCVPKGEAAGITGVFGGWSAYNAGDALSKVQSAEAYAEEVKAVVDIAMEEAERSLQGLRNYVTDQGKLNMIAGSQDFQNSVNVQEAMDIAEKKLKKEFKKLRADAKKVKSDAATYLKMVREYEAFLEKVHAEAEAKSQEYLALIKDATDTAEASRTRVENGRVDVVELQTNLRIMKGHLAKCGPELTTLLGEKGKISKAQAELQKLTEQEHESSQVLGSERSQLEITLNSLGEKNRNAQLEVDRLTGQLEEIQRNVDTDLATEKKMSRNKDLQQMKLKGAQATNEAAKAMKAELEAEF